MLELVRKPPAQEADGEEPGLVAAMDRIANSLSLVVRLGKIAAAALLAIVFLVALAALRTLGV